MAILRIGSVTIMDGAGGKNRPALVISDRHLVTFSGFRPLVYEVRPFSEPDPRYDPLAGPEEGTPSDATTPLEGHGFHLPTLSPFARLLAGLFAVETSTWALGGAPNPDSLFWTAFALAVLGSGILTTYWALSEAVARGGTRMGALIAFTMVLAIPGHEILLGLISGPVGRGIWVALSVAWAAMLIRIAILRNRC
jgi:hypothetical protein